MPKFTRTSLNGHPDMVWLLQEYTTDDHKKQGFRCQTCKGLIQSKDGTNLIYHALNCCL